MSNNSHNFMQSLKVILLSPYSVFALALAVRLFYVLLMSAEHTSDEVWAMFPDSRVYVSIAEYIRGTITHGESAMLMAGPGYGFIILIWKLIAGNSVWLFLLFQSLVGALSAMLIWQLCVRLQLSESVASLAGYIFAFSITAVSLSSAVLGETFFVFCLLLLLIYAVRFLESHTTKDAVVLIVLAVALTLIRSVGAFLVPALAVALVLYAILSKEFVIKRPRLSLIVIAGVVLGSMIWPLRNYVTHDVFTVAETGVRAARLYWTAEVVAGTDHVDSIKVVRERWDQEIAELYPGHIPTYREMHDFDARVVRDTLLQRPAAMIGEYCDNILSNVTERSYLQRTQLPQFHQFWYELDTKVLKKIGDPLIFVTLLGAIALWLNRHRRTVVILGAVYLYFAATSGATFWQGSRIFFPGAMCGVIPQSAGLIWIAKSALAVWRKVSHRPN